MVFDWTLLVTAATGALVTVSLYVHRDRKNTINKTLDDIKNSQHEAEEESKCQHKAVLATQKEIYEEVKKTNGKVIALEKFASMHEEADNRRFQALERAINRSGGSP